MANINFDFALPANDSVPTPMDTVQTQTSAFTGISTGIIADGSVFKFWGMGHTSSGGSLSNGQTYYIMTGSDYAQLSQWYQGDTMVCSLWIISGTNSYQFPLFVDATGIYFTCNTGGVSFNAGALFGFNFSLLLSSNRT